MAAGASAAPAEEASQAEGLNIPRGTRMQARLDGVADPNAPGPVAAKLSQPVSIGGKVVLPSGTPVVCEVAGATGARVSVTCDSLVVDGRTVAFGGVAYGRDGRPGLAVAVSGGEPGEAASAAVTTGERLAQRLRPEGVVGDVVEGVTEAASSNARRRAAGGAATLGAVPKGTSFSSLVTQAF